MLLISTALALAALTVARVVFPLPARLEQSGPPSAAAKGFTRAYWLYMVAAACFGSGLMSFEFILYHLSVAERSPSCGFQCFLRSRPSRVSSPSLVLGRLYDRFGLPVILAAIAIACLFSPLVFLGGFAVALIGLSLWGIGYAVQDTLLKALVAGMCPRAGATWHSGSSTRGMAWAGSLAAPRQACSTRARSRR